MLGERAHTADDNLEEIHQKVTFWDEVWSPGVWGSLKQQDQH